MELGRPGYSPAQGTYSPVCGFLSPHFLIQEVGTTPAIQQSCVQTLSTERKVLSTGLCRCLIKHVSAKLWVGALPLLLPDCETERYVGLLLGLV